MERQSVRPSKVLKLHDRYGLALRVRRDKNPKMRGIGGTDEVNNESLSELGKENSLRLARCMLTVSQRSHDTL